MPSMTAKSRIAPTTIDDYLAALPGDQRAALEKLRSSIRTIVPDAQQCISYQLPTFRFQGRMLVSIGATPNYCAFYVLSAATLPAHKDALVGYDTSKSVIRFQPDRPLPAALLRKLIKARIAENAAASGKSVRRR
ncbi:MAG: DUF1801 domain-containing protein [Phycisphaerae bacterium]